MGFISPLRIHVTLHVYILSLNVLFFYSHLSSSEGIAPACKNSQEADVGEEIKEKDNYKLKNYPHKNQELDMNWWNYLQQHWSMCVCFKTYWRM